jgi:hypothetical protein
MADREYTSHQRKIISRFYDNRETMDEQKLAELCTNLFLASGKKRQNFWETARDAMTRLGVPPERVEHVVKSDDPALLAVVVEELQRGTLRRVPAPKGNLANPAADKPEPKSR